MFNIIKFQGPVVQSNVSITSSLVVNMFTFLVSKIDIFAEKKICSFCKCKNISVYAIFNEQSFNDMLTNDIVSFEQLGRESH